MVVGRAGDQGLTVKWGVVKVGSYLQLFLVSAKKWQKNLVARQKSELKVLSRRHSMNNKLPNQIMSQQREQNAFRKSDKKYKSTLSAEWVVQTTKHTGMQGTGALKWWSRKKELSQPCFSMQGGWSDSKCYEKALREIIYNLLPHNFRIK